MIKKEKEGRYNLGKSHLVRSTALYIVIILSISFSSAFNFEDSNRQDINIYQGNLTNLSELQDVSITNPQEDWILGWSTSVGKWVAQAAENVLCFITGVDVDNNENSLLIVNSSGALGYNNTVFNSKVQTVADTLYYSINNTNSYYNSTDFNISDYYLNTNEYSFYNSTTLENISQLNNDNNFWNDTYATFNKSYADTLYYSITNPFSFYNSTTLENLSQLTNDLGIGNWTADKTNYYTKTEVDTNISNANTSLANWADSKFADLSGGNSFSGQQDFNGGWTSNGLSIVDGDLYAQAVYTPNIYALNVSNIAVNGSIIPQEGYDNQFDFGNSSLRWRDLYLGGEIFSNGTGNNYFLGNVGIGTTSPGTKLHVVGNAQLQGEDVYLRLRDTTNSKYLQMDNSGNLNILKGDRATSIIHFGQSGKVGIGTTSPSDKLHIFGVGADANGQLRLQYSSGNPEWGIRAGSAGDFSIKQSGTSRIAIDSSGNVGIGTTSPGALLEVGGASIDGEIIVNSTAGRVGVFEADDDGNFVHVGSQTDHSFYIVQQDIRRLGFGSDDNIDFFNNNGNETVTILNSGNVGIGTASPLSKVHINGTPGALGGGLTFGDGDTGLYEYAENQLMYTGGGTDRYRFTTGGIVSTGNGFNLARNDVESAPTYTFAADSDTGVSGNVGDNYLSLVTNGSNRLTVDGTGNVGIGTTSPGAKLDINGSINQSSNAVTLLNGIYGGIYSHNDSGIEVDMAVQDAYYNFTNGICNTNSYVTCNNATQNNLTVQYNGVYRVNYIGTGVGQNNHLYHSIIFVNGVEQDQTEGHMLAGAGDVLPISNFGHLTLNAGDVVHAGVRDSSGTGTLTIYNTHLELIRIGNL